MVKVMETIWPEVTQNEIAHFVYRALFENAAEIHNNIEILRCALMLGTVSRSCLSCEYVGENRHLIISVLHKVRRNISDKHIVVFRLEASEASFEFLFAESVASVCIKASVYHIGDRVLALVVNVGESGVIVDERRASEANAIEIEHNINGIHRPGLVANFHTTQDNLVQESRETILGFWVLRHELGERIIAIHKVIVIYTMLGCLSPEFIIRVGDLGSHPRVMLRLWCVGKRDFWLGASFANARVEVLKRYELALFLEELVILGSVLHENVIREIDGPLYVTVVGTRHCTVH